MNTGKLTDKFLRRVLIFLLMSVSFLMTGCFNLGKPMDNYGNSIPENIEESKGNSGTKLSEDKGVSSNSEGSGLQNNKKETQMPEFLGGRIPKKVEIPTEPGQKESLEMFSDKSEDGNQQE